MQARRAAALPPPLSSCFQYDLITLYLWTRHGRNQGFPNPVYLFNRKNRWWEQTRKEKQNLPNSTKWLWLLFFVFCFYFLFCCCLERKCGNSIVGASLYNSPIFFIFFFFFFFFFSSRFSRQAGLWAIFL
jgi:hypothetical protein